jgi:hypothetical protein
MTDDVSRRSGDEKKKQKLLAPFCACAVCFSLLLASTYGGWCELKNGERNATRQPKSVAKHAVTNAHLRPHFSPRKLGT